MLRLPRLLLAAMAVTAVASAVVLAQPRQQRSTGDAARDEDVTPPDKYGEEAEKSLGKMRVAMRKGLDEVKAARRERDNVRLLCVNEPVAAMKGVLRIGETAYLDLQEAIAKSQAATARREFRKIVGGRRQMDNLLSAAQNCAGVSSSESTTSVELQVDEGLLAFDPYYGDDGFFYDPTDDLIDGDTDLGDDTASNARPPNASGIL